MGTGGITSNAHVVSPTWHHKHVPPMDDDSVLQRDIGELLSRWGGLQMAVKNQWGGHDSLKKSQELAHNLFHLISQSNVITVEEIENLLHESLLLSFNTEIEDGSIEEVAEQLMILHEEHLRGTL
ncbi:putative pre-rRNA-processing protein TSR2 [Arabidopsis thaliana]|uniref:At3g22510 n=4 Tax=Arabidopsis TaxID=3701 RepID=Q6AWV8_ARATH|nr:Pre-rRNA-processing protein TSR2, conserved region [Arabidopsis thaliana]KAG7626209.1 Pre-rRNA-processing protein TSR2 [Arabidopsis thaliana x Arabidopsis arenosa]KAG7632199.1 Pre-rRNA-processing protein TSR2 [Arabidopsis suecica]AAT85736.1 At3g22510 [Arabidopsis thaliana]AAU15150.1 At3g22510 [Arabidopsis thaliana]AEE76648.1 Pre-rRNA-processing protein TSR2, conserved region [Arabidopsis thaliana]|eukprot:NP_188890.2 Pre-rRNA-processing protein TSR2, conserved region [Arabidopsis thaliana]